MSYFNDDSLSDIHNLSIKSGEPYVDLIQDDAVKVIQKQWRKYKGIKPRLPEKLLEQHEEFIRTSYECCKYALKTYNEEIADAFNKIAIEGTISER